MTQETLGKGIISNTFVSKLENNAIHANKECLMLLMERLDLPADIVDLPEDMLEYLDRSLKYYYWSDVPAYQKLMVEISKFEFAVLIQIVRLGYHVMVRETEEAIRIFNDLCRYFPSMDDRAFTVFMVYSAEAMIMEGDYQSARECLEAAEQIMPADHRLTTLVRHHQSVVHSFTHHWALATHEAAEARRCLEESGNLRRIMRMNVDRFQFRLSNQTEWTIPYETDQLRLLDSYDADRYRFLRGIQETEHENLLEEISSESEWYPLTLFCRCWQAKTRGRTDEYRKLMTKWDQAGNRKLGPIDFRHLLLLAEKPDLGEYKDYLIDIVLSWAIRRNDLFILKKTTKEIVRILTLKKRYKDACVYTEKLARETERIREIKKLKPEASVLED